MLQAIRDKAHGIFAWIMLIAIGVPFALWGIQNYLDTGKEPPLAVVGKSEIFERDVNRVYEQSLANLVGLGQFDEADLKREALERLIREELMLQNADDHGMVITDEDVRSFVQTLPYFQTDGKFDKEKYKLMLNSQGLDPGQFIAQVRKTLMLEQYQRGLVDTSFVTSRQLDDFYRLRNQQREFDYVTVPIKKYEGAFSNEQIEAYYRDNSASFRDPERVSIQYVSISIDEIAASIKPSEDELRALYEEQKKQSSTAERRKVSHILLTVDAGQAGAEQAVREKALALKRRLDAGEDFAKLAKEFSEDTASAEKGGDLGFITREAMEPNFSAAAFQLDKGRVSEPVKTSFGYHLIKVTEIDAPQTRSFEEMRAELEKSAQRSAAENKFYELSQVLAEQGFEHPDSLEPVARSLNLTIKETGLFTREQGEGIAAEESVRKAAFSQEVLAGRNSEPVEVGNDRVYLLRLKEHQPAADKPLEQVRQIVIERLRETHAREEARKQAMQLVEWVRQGKSLGEAAKSRGLSVVHAGFVGRNADKLSPALVQAVFKAPRPQDASRPSIDLVASETGEYIVFHVRSVSDGSVNTVDAKELDMARDFLAKNQGQSDLSAYLQELRAQGDVYVKPRP